jgi:hypothetical protein
MKQRLFMPLIGDQGKPNIGLSVVGCSNLALFFLRLQTGHTLHLFFDIIVGMKPASASKHTQDEAKRQDQQHFIVVLELAEDWSQITHMKRPTPPVNELDGRQHRRPAGDPSFALNNREK